MFSKSLSNEELERYAPALFTQEPHSNVSDKYHFIPTIDIVEEIRENGWFPVKVDEARVREDRKSVV